MIAGSKEEIKELTERLDKTAKTYGMEISAEKSKILVTSRVNEDDEQIVGCQLARARPR